MDPDPSLTARRQQLLDILIPEDMEDPLSSDEGVASFFCTVTRPRIRRETCTMKHGRLNSVK